MLTVCRWQFPSVHRHAMTTCLHVDVPVEACTHGIFQLHWPSPHDHGINTWLHVDVAPAHRQGNFKGLPMTIAIGASADNLSPCRYVHMVHFKFYCLLVTFHWWVPLAHRQSNFKGVPMAIAIGASARYDNLSPCRCAGERMYTWYISMALTMASWPWCQELPGCRCAGGGMPICWCTRETDSDM